MQPRWLQGRQRHQLEGGLGTSFYWFSNRPALVDKPLAAGAVLQPCLCSNMLQLLLPAPMPRCIVITLVSICAFPTTAPAGPGVPAHAQLHSQPPHDGGGQRAQAPLPGLPAGVRAGGGSGVWGVVHCTFPAAAAAAWSPLSICLRGLCPVHASLPGILPPALRGQLWLPLTVCGHVSSCPLRRCTPTISPATGAASAGAATSTPAIGSPATAAMPGCTSRATSACHAVRSGERGAGRRVCVLLVLWNKMQEQRCC